MKIWPGNRRDLIVVAVFLWVMLVLWMPVGILLLEGTQDTFTIAFLTVGIITVTGFSLAIAATVKAWRTK